MSYAFPIERPLPFGAWDTCHGPFQYGSTQIAQYQTRWVCWVATSGMRFGKWTEGVLFNDTDGQADDLFPGVRPAHLSFSFEQDALHAIAIESAPGTVEIRRKVSGTPTSYTFAGLSPVLFYNGIVVADTPTTDLTCFYIKAAGTKIFVRRQRDNFGIEYELNPTIHGTLRALQKTDALLINGANRQLLWALTTEGRQVYFMSGPYPPFPQYGEDRMELSLGFDEGIYFPNVILVSPPGDAVGVDVGFSEGELLSTIHNVFAPGDAVALDLGFDSGICLNTIVQLTAPGDAVAVDHGFDSGIYALVVVTTTLPADAASVDVGFESGVYS